MTNEFHELLWLLGGRGGNNHSVVKLLEKVRGHSGEVSGRQHSLKVECDPDKWRRVGG